MQKEMSEQSRRETSARLTAPQHLVTTRFEKHQKIEGYEQDRVVPEFYGCDRLWKMDTLYGRIQMGYHPGRGQSFIFANIKTSIFDTAPSAYQHRMKETQQMRALKTGTQNQAYSSRRWNNSAVLLYKAENKPWSEQSIAPYLRRVNLETLRKTMPFLDRSEAGQREESREERKRLEQQVRQSLREGNDRRTAELRLQERELSREQDALNALLIRKQTQSQLFFRKINIAFDLQKAKMFDYYRRMRNRRMQHADEMQAAAGTEETTPNVQNERRDN